MKTCTRCEQDLHVDEFRKNKAKEDGLSVWCKACIKAYRVEFGIKKPDGWVRKTADKKAYQKEYREANREKLNALHDKWQKAHPKYVEEKNRRRREKERAKRLIIPRLVLPAATRAKRKRCVLAIRNAIRNGSMFRLPCFVCGAAETHGHHPDYDKPLDVVWLCPTHHRETHALVG